MTDASGHWSPLREQAETIAAALPPLLVAAERLASAVSLGVHGRRKAGIGETFWQFRRYQTEDPTTAIDWRQSAKSQYLFVREREWEAAEAVWLWRDGGPTMRFASGGMTKIDRASLLAMALGSLLIRGGERIGLLGDGRAPSSSRVALSRIAHELSTPPSDDEPAAGSAHGPQRADRLVQRFSGTARRTRSLDAAYRARRADGSSRAHRRSGGRGFSVCGPHALRIRPRR